MEKKIEDLLRRGKRRKLASLLKHSKNSDIQKDAAIALGELNNIRSKNVLLKALWCGNSDVQKAVIEALKKLKIPEINQIDTSSDNQKCENPFKNRLREEIIHHKSKRANFVLQKLAFIVGLLGIGSFQIIEKNDIINIYSGWVLYCLPIIALAYDVFIYAEDYKVKRIGTFLRTCSLNITKCEWHWELFVNSHREPYAVWASFCLTMVTILPVLVFNLFPNNTIKDTWITFIYSLFILFKDKWIPFIYLLFCIIISITVFVFYGWLRAKLERINFNPNCFNNSLGHSK